MSAAVADHPLLFDVPSVPKRQRSKWEELQEMARCQEAEGGLAPPAVVATLLDVSNQRVCQLMDEGTFTRHEFFERPFISVNEVRQFIELDRKTGRPWNEPSAKEMWRRARKTVRAK